MALTAGSHPQNKQSTRQLGERQTGAGTSSICSRSAQPPDLQPPGAAVQPPAGLGRGREQLEVHAGCAQGSAHGVSQVDSTQLCCLGQLVQIFITSMASTSGFLGSTCLTSLAAAFQPARLLQLCTVLGPVPAQGTGYSPMVGMAWAQHGALG